MWTLCERWKLLIAALDAVSQAELAHGCREGVHFACSFMGPEAGRR